MSEPQFYNISGRVFTMRMPSEDTDTMAALVKEILLPDVAKAFLQQEKPAAILQRLLNSHPLMADIAIYNYCQKTDTPIHFYGKILARYSHPHPTGLYVQATLSAYVTCDICLEYIKDNPLDTYQVAVWADGKQPKIYLTQGLAPFDAITRILREHFNYGYVPGAKTLAEGSNTPTEVHYIEPYYLAATKK